MKTRIVMLIIQELFNFTHWKLQIETETTLLYQSKSVIDKSPSLIGDQTRRKCKKMSFY